MPTAPDNYRDRKERAKSAKFLSSVLKEATYAKGAVRFFAEPKVFAFFFLRLE
jgi:hypothetical protein